jgi:hypothetical protein
MRPAAWESDIIALRCAVSVKEVRSLTDYFSDLTPSRHHYAVARVEFWHKSIIRPQGEIHLSYSKTLSDRRQVSGELVFLDDQMVCSIELNEIQILEPLHKHADPRPRRAYH